MIFSCPLDVSFCLSNHFVESAWKYSDHIRLCELELQCMTDAQNFCNWHTFVCFRMFFSAVVDKYLL